MIKRYLQFIKESVIDEKVWKMSESDIRDIFVEMQDEGYVIEIEFGCSKTIMRSGKVERIFNDKIFSGELINPSYFIKIYAVNRISDVDVTHCIKFANSIMEEKANAYIDLCDAGGVLDIDHIQVKGGLFIDDDLEAEDYIAFHVIQRDSVKLTQKELSEFYKWEVDEIVGDNIFTHVSLEDMVNDILPTKSSYSKYLLNGEGSLDDLYLSGEYNPDTNSLLQYELDKENKILLIKSLIKQYGGLDNLIKKSNNEKLIGLSENEVIDFLIHERFKKTLEFLCKDSERDSDILSEIKSICGDYSMNAHIHTNYMEIVKAFDEVVEEICDFKKIEKKINKIYSGKPYEVDETFYVIKYSNEWIEEVDPEDIKNKKLDYLFREWISNQSITRDLDPRFSDYGDVDSKSVNNDIRITLNNFLNR